MSFLLRMLMGGRFEDLEVIKMYREFFHRAGMWEQIIQKRFQRINNSANNFEHPYQRKSYPLRIINSDNLGCRNYCKK